jgi:hypothetical protein
MKKFVCNISMLWAKINDTCYANVSNGEHEKLGGIIKIHGNPNH